jgi:hypothetical protein
VLVLVHHRSSRRLRCSLKRAGHFDGLPSRVANKQRAIQAIHQGECVGFDLSGSRELIEVIGKENHNSVSTVVLHARDTDRTVGAPPAFKRICDIEFVPRECDAPSIPHGADPFLLIVFRDRVYQRIRLAGRYCGGGVSA